MAAVILGFELPPTPLLCPQAGRTEPVFGQDLNIPYSSVRQLKLEEGLLGEGLSGKRCFAERLPRKNDWVIPEIPVRKAPELRGEALNRPGALIGSVSRIAGSTL